MEFYPPRYLKPAVTLLLFFCCCFTLVSQALPAAEQGRTHSHVNLLGVLEDEQVRQTQIDRDAFLVSVNVRSKTFETRPYYLLVRNVSTLEKDVLEDAADGVWDKYDLFLAALIAEGARDRNKIARYQKRFDEVVAEINRQSQGLERQKDKHEKLTKIIFETLHKRILTGKYGAGNTSISIAMEKGDYNCVSATILFNALVRKCKVGQDQLQVFGLEKSGHVLSRVRYGSQYIDLETTCPDWFNLNGPLERARATWAYSVTPTKSVPQPRTAHRVAKPNVSDASSLNRQNTIPIGLKPENLPTRPGEKIVAMPAANAQGNAKDVLMREISDVQLIAAVYYNQGYEYWMSGNLPEAIAATAKALHLDKDNKNAWENLTGAINNKALEFTNEHKMYEMSADLLDQIAVLDHEFRDLNKNRLYVYNKWLGELIAEESYDYASFVLATAMEKLPNHRDELRPFEALIP